MIQLIGDYKRQNKAVSLGSGYSGALLSGVYFQPFLFFVGFRYAPPAR
jgi:hypothetical protein